MTMIITAAVVIGAIVGVAVIMQKNRQQETKPEAKIHTAPAPKSANSTEQELKAIMDSLLRLNILIRKDEKFSTAMKGTIEKIIDDLILITPEMMERYPSETLTYEIKKIGKNHLYKTVKEYLDLSLESRENQFDIFDKTIKNLHEISNRSKDIVEKNETAEFKTMANFLAGKFS